MSNEYFDATTVTAFTRARAASINAISNGTEAGFDMLPTEAALHRTAKPALTPTGTANALILTNATNDAITAYAMGQKIAFKAAHTNSGATTVNVDGIGVKNLLRMDGSNLSAADLTSGRMYEAIYDGTAFQLVLGIVDVSEGGIASYIAEISGWADDAEAAAAAAEAAAASVSAFAFPGAGLVVSTGSAWGTSKAAPTGTVVGHNDAQTLSNKTLVDPAITGAILEDLFTITDGAAFEIDPSNGTLQKIVLGASRSPLATNFANGESVLLKIDDGSGFSITWPTVTWVGGTAPTLATSGWTWVELWKMDNALYGARVGATA